MGAPDSKDSGSMVRSLMRWLAQIRRWSTAEKALGLLAALLVLSGLMLSTAFLQESREMRAARSAILDQGQQMDSLQHRLDADEHALKALQDARDEHTNRLHKLEQASTPGTPGAAATPGTAGTPGTSPRGDPPDAGNDADPDPAVRHKGDDPTLIDGGAGIDLNAPKSDRSWGQREDDIDASDRVVFRYGGLSSDGANYAKLDRSRTASYKSCRDATGLAGLDITATDFEGKTICVQLSDKRVATLRVKKVGSTSVTLEITTWELS